MNQPSELQVQPQGPVLSIALTPLYPGPLGFTGGKPNLASPPHALTCYGPQPQGIHDTHTSHDPPTPAHVHTGQAPCWGSAEMLTAPCQAALSTMFLTAIQPEPASDLSPVPARPLPPPSYPRVPLGSLHQPGPRLQEPLLCAGQGEAAWARGYASGRGARWREWNSLGQLKAERSEHPGQCWS